MIPRPRGVSFSRSLRGPRSIHHLASSTGGVFSSAIVTKIILTLAVRQDNVGSTVEKKCSQDRRGGDLLLSGSRWASASLLPSTGLDRLLSMKTFSVGRLPRLRSRPLHLTVYAPAEGARLRTPAAVYIYILKSSRVFGAKRVFKSSRFLMRPCSCAYCTRVSSTCRFASRPYGQSSSPKSSRSFSISAIDHVIIYLRAENSYIVSWQSLFDSEKALHRLWATQGFFS